MTGSAGQPRSRPGGAIIAAAVAIVAGVAVAVALLVSSGSGSDSSADLPDGGSSTTVSSPPTTTEVAAGQLSAPSTSTSGTAPDAAQGSGSSTTVFTATVVTVEADNATSDATSGNPGTPPAGGQGAGGQNSGDTAPTVPAPISGTCRIAMAGLDGQSGTFDMGSDGTCGSLAATIQAVNPRDDLADLVWGRDIRLCERHPAASEVAVSITTAAATTDIDGGLARAPDEGAADPIVSIEITFADQATPLTGPRPVLACRTSTAELSIVHRPAS